MSQIPDIDHTDHTSIPIGECVEVHCKMADGRWVYLKSSGQLFLDMNVESVPLHDGMVIVEHHTAAIIEPIVQSVISDKRLSDEEVATTLNE